MSLFDCNMTAILIDVGQKDKCIMDTEGYPSKLAPVLKILTSRINDLFTLPKRQSKKSVIHLDKDGPTDLAKRPQALERLRPDQLDDYTEEARRILVDVAKRRTLITYDLLMYKLNCGPGRNLCGYIVRRVSEIEIAQGRPKLSAVVIRSDTRTVGSGFFGLPSTPNSIKQSDPKEFHRHHIDWEEQEYWQGELHKVYDYWCPKPR